MSNSTIRAFKQAQLKHLGPLISLTEWAEGQDISTRRARILCEQGRVRGAEKIGAHWVVPTYATYAKKQPGRKPQSRKD